MLTQNRPKTAATASIIFTHPVALQGTSDSPRWFQDRFINLTQWFRAYRRRRRSVRKRNFGAINRGRSNRRRLRLWSGLLLSGFAGISLGACRTCLAWGACGPRRSGGSRRSGEATVLYQRLSLILPGGDLDHASGGEL
jgi:hypothetical protein